MEELKYEGPEIADSNNDGREFIEFLAEWNTKDFNILKFSEEVAELQEKLLKFHLKKAENKPPLQEIIDEIGDVLIRISIFSQMTSTENIDMIDLVGERIGSKLQKMLEYYKEGKYTHGI